MTDRHAGYLVTLDEDIREDDAQDLITAIEMLRGVLNVTPVTSDRLITDVTEQRRDAAWRVALANLVRNGPEEIHD
jgi:hypothetical protein